MAGRFQCGHLQLDRIVSDHVLFSFALVISILGHRYNVHCEKNGPGQGMSTASKTTDGPRVSPLGDHDHMTKKR